ncbi:hypothetical protein H1R20_g254, partial [Candolleomyces eurysporus]
MANRVNSRFSPYPQRPARGTTDDGEVQGHRGGTRNRNHLARDTLLPIPQTVFFQQGSQGPIFNGPIAGGVTHNHAPNIDVFQILCNHSATGAMHDSNERYPPPLCHPGTREAVVVRIKDWYGYQQGPGKPIMWVHAPAGYGKTAIAGTISKILEEIEGLDFNPLGATFFFWRTSAERNNPTRFIITIAHQLAISIPELKPHIANAVSQSPLILKKALEIQLIKLIVEPFQALGDLKHIPNRLVIIDGLDECINSEQELRAAKKYAEDQEIVQVRVLDLIHALQSHHLPLSFLILSRPEAWIKHHIESRSFTDLVEVVDLYTVGDHMNDVEKYVRAELSRIAAKIGDVEWPTESIVHNFVRKTNGHMVYASTVIRHINDPYDDPRKRLKDILDAPTNSNPGFAKSASFSSLYKLYSQIMESCPESNRSLMVEVLEDTIITTDWFWDSNVLPRALHVFDSLSSRAAGCGARAIRGLHAVVRVSDSPNEFTPSPRPRNPFVHSSFVEFLTNPDLSFDFAVDKKKGARRLLWNCLECMSTIDSQSKIEEDHLQFACYFFQPLWVTSWSIEKDAQLLQDEYVEVVKKLLTIDLTTCLIKVTQYPNSPLLNRIPKIFSPEFVDSLEHLSKESDPLYQQAVTHVLSSTRRAMHHLCHEPVVYFSDRQVLLYYLEGLYYRSENSNQRKSDEVTQALSNFRPASSISAWDMTSSFLSHIRPILDYIRQNNL